jgi:hypothetical protein
MDYIFGLVYSISRYDTWEWMENPSRDHNENLCSRILSVYKFNELSNSIVDRVTGLIYDIGVNFIETTLVIGHGDLYPGRYFTKEQLAAYDVILRQLNMEKEKLGKNLRIEVKHIATINGLQNVLTGYYIPTDFKFVSEISDYINKQLCNSKLEMVVILYPQSTTLSFRTCKDDVDVSILASVYDGGGHKKAAGAKLTNNEFIVWYRKYLACESYDEIDKSIFDD